MKAFGTHLLVLLAILLAVSTVTADDIGFLTVRNSVQAEVAEGIVGYAFTRVENRFLVAIDAQQKELLAKSGLEFESVIAEGDPSSTYIIRQLDRNIYDQATLSKLTGTFDLGAGMKLTEFTSTAASAMAESPGLAVNALSEKEIPFRYVPTNTTSLLALVDDFPTDTVVDRISADSIYAYVTRLEAFETRYIWSDSIDAARDWIVQKFLDWGYVDVTTPEFWWDEDWHYNVMAVKPGYAEPDKVIIIGGHYDSITYGEEPGAFLYAPGADDNASGTVTTMEIARILADIPFRKTIIFMPFSAEEVGLVGSYYAAWDFAYSGTDIEVMYNYDMVAYTEDSYWNIHMMGGPIEAYRDAEIDAANRVTTLIPEIVGLSGSSDHWSFYEHGFNISYGAEGDFNYDGWHTNLDISSRLNFPYLTEVVKMAAAAIAHVADAAHPTEITNIIDQGDGQSLEVFWSSCDPTYTYTVYYGTVEGSPTNSVVIPAGECSHIVTGLTDGVTYYFSVVGEASGGYPALYSIEGSATPYLIPRPPTGLAQEPDYWKVLLDWADNAEADFSHYRVYRDDGDGYVQVADNITSSDHEDTDVLGQTLYLYQVTAVDGDGYESTASDPIGGYAATFDGGVLLADETAEGPPLTDQTGQEEFFESIFAGTPYGLALIDDRGVPLEKSLAGQYSSVFWIDDDLNIRLINDSEPTLDWFTDYTANIFVAGMRTVTQWALSPIPTDHMLYQEFGLAGHHENQNWDFVGAAGTDSWPSIETNPSSPLAKMPFIPSFDLRTGAEVIYTYDSFTDDPAYEGQPCGILYNSIHGKRVLLGFPLSYLTEESAYRLIQRVLTEFGEGPEYIPGDVDGSGQLDVADLVYLVNYMFNEGSVPIVMNSADVDGSCRVDIADLVYLVKYSFYDPPGPAPVTGCAK